MDFGDFRDFELYSTWAGSDGVVWAAAGGGGPCPVLVIYET